MVAGPARRPDVGDPDRPHAGLRGTRVVGPPCGPARRRTPHRRGRLLGPARLLDLRSRWTARRCRSPSSRSSDGEVSPYLVEDMELGDQLEIRGPIGGWFVWSPSPEAPVEQPILLVAGGSGVVPLMAMVRERARLGSKAPFRLVYSVRDPDQVMYADELERRASAEELLVDLVHTRSAPPGSSRPAGRISRSRPHHSPIGRVAHRRRTACLRLRPYALRRARHRPPARARLHRQDHPRRTLRTHRDVT